MAYGINTNVYDKNNPYLSQWYAQLGTNLNESPTGPNDLRNALQSYNYHLNNRKFLAQQRPERRS